MCPPPRLTHEQRNAVESFRKQHRTGVLTLLFTDVVGSTALKRELGDSPGTALIESHQTIVRTVLGGFAEAQEISTAGDSFFICFVRPSDSVRFALLLQSALRNAGAQTPKPLAVRIGIHMGEVFVDREPESSAVRDVLGMQVDIAHAIMEMAGGGQTLTSRSVFDNARAILRGEEMAGLVPISWLNHGPYRHKDVDEAFDVCEVGEEALAPLSPPPDSAEARRFIPSDVEPVLGWRPALGLAIPGSEWELQRKVGEGGFGEVWLAFHETLREQRVFKFCFRADRVRSLKREATLFRLLKERVGEHPNIVRIFNVYFSEPPYYIETEYVEGKNLAEWCADRGGPASIPEETRLEIVARVADALQAAHDAGIVHRDIKPSNVLIRGDGSSPEQLDVKLTDFGIGQLASANVLIGESGTGLTETIARTELASRSGTRIYMAPEVLAGDRSSSQSDIYSLGVVLYQLMIGSFSRPLTVDWRDNVEDPVVGEDLARCFAGDPAARFQSAGQLAESLRAVEERRRRRPIVKCDWQLTCEPCDARLSRTALVGAVLAALFFMLVVVYFVPATTTVQRVRGDADELTVTPMPWVQEVNAALVAIALGLPFATTILGGVAVRQIRRSAGRLRGLWLAYADATLFPILVVNVAIVCLAYHLAGMARAGKSFAVFQMLVLAAIVWVIADFHVVRLGWRAVKRRCGIAIPSAKDDPARMARRGRMGAFASGVALGGAFLILLILGYAAGEAPTIPLILLWAVFQLTAHILGSFAFEHWLGKTAVAVSSAVLLAGLIVLMT